MINKAIDSKLFKSKIIAEVHINNTLHDQLDMNVVVLKQDKQSLEIDRTHHSVNSLEEFSGCIPQKVPLSLIIDGKGVIQKAVQKKESIPIIYQVLPNVQHQEFLWQETALSQPGLMQVAVARKEFIEGWISRFTQMGYMVVDVSIGPMVLSNIVSLLPKGSSEVRVKNYKIKYNDQGIFDISKNGTDEKSYNVQIGTEQISNQDLIPFAAGVKYFKDSILPGDSLAEICRPLREQYTFKKIYQLLLFGSIGLLFVILLINFLLFDHYSKQYNYYQDQYQVNKGLLDRLTHLENEFSKQQTFFTDNAGRGFSRYAYYADILAFLLPATITLTELSFDPIRDNIKQDREIQNAQGLIVMAGETGQSLELNKYINEIEKQEWVEDVTLIEYQSEINKRGEFTIEVSLKPEAK